jgi:N-acetylneuraminate synthase
MRYDTSFMIGRDEISLSAPTVFIADIAANHDGDLERAKTLIKLARHAGAAAAKFQHFKAERIVSDYGFRSLGGQLSHQATWDKPVSQIYAEYSLNRDWNEILVETARDVGIHWMTTPYDIEAVNSAVQLLPAFKIGSGDITWPAFIRHVACQGKPVLLATGASSMLDVEAAVEAVLAVNRQLCLLQCNTNYTGSLDNFRFVNLRVLQAYALHWPGLPLGLSDHTPGHATVLGAVALGARVIEKHFTDDVTRKGPDHAFSMTPQTWRAMVDRTRELENALGDGVKRVEGNEVDTVILQRRCLRTTRRLSAGEVIRESDLEALRPAPGGAMEPYALGVAVGKRLARAKDAGDALFWRDLEGDARA